MGKIGKCGILLRNVRGVFFFFFFFFFFNISLSSAEYIPRHLSDIFNIPSLFPVDPPFLQTPFGSDALYLSTRTK
jgi:hypothetical protein